MLVSYKHKQYLVTSNNSQLVPNEAVNIEYEIACQLVVSDLL